MRRLALARIAPRRLAFEQGEASSSVAFALPASDAYPLDLFHARRALVGGRLARAWVAFTVGGTLRVFSFSQGGSRADPTVFVPALEDATHTYVPLGASSVTADEARTALIAAAAGVGVTITANGTDAQGRAICVVEGGSGLVIPPAVAHNNALRGMWGAQRDDWGEGTGVAVLNADGGTSGTGSMHVGNPGAALSRAGRILGVYLWGHTGHAPRLAASSGPAYSTSPGAMTILGQGVAAALNGFGGALFDAAAIADSDELWAHYRENAAGGPRYRLHGQTPVGRGNLGTGQVLVWDTTASASAASAFGASYSPTADATFGIYVMIGVIFELEDENGNYPADGSLDTWIGDQNTDPDHGTQFDAGPALIDNETTHHRFLLPDWQSIRVTQVRRGVAAIAADEDSRACFYGPWLDLDFPATTPPDLIADVGLMGLAGNSDAITTLTLPSPVDLAPAAGQYGSLGFNYVTSDGSSVDTYTLPVFLDAASGDASWLNCWVDDRETWHDDIRGASDRAPTSGVSEYRTLVAGMPIDAWADTYPATFDTDASDDSPAAIALDAFRVQLVGIAEVA
jgi:hypothetical protein